MNLQSFQMHKEIHSLLSNLQKLKQKSLHRILPVKQESFKGGKIE